MMTSSSTLTTGVRNRPHDCGFRAVPVLMSLALPLFLAAVPANAETYTARILHNTGTGFSHSSARGTHDGVQVGFVWNATGGNLKRDNRIDFHPVNDAAL